MFAIINVGSALFKTMAKSEKETTDLSEMLSGGSAGEFVDKRQTETARSVIGKSLLYYLIERVFSRA